VTPITEARLYLVSGASIVAGELVAFVPGLAAAGVDLIQLREKEMEAGDIARVGRPLARACAEADVCFILNDRADVALALDAPGVHLGQNDLPVAVARRILGTAIVGWSTHSEADIDAVARSDAPIDYIAVGPVYETPTKPGRQAVGLDLVRYAARHALVPWFAIGGINASNLDDVLEAGARRIVVVRAITEAKDPVAAAAELRERLDEVPLSSSGRIRSHGDSR
jgi:thiamine-phosphate pyrophosphorylase